MKTSRKCSHVRSQSLGVCSNNMEPTEGIDKTRQTSIDMDGGHGSCKAMDQNVEEQGRQEKLKC